MNIFHAELAWVDQAACAGINPDLFFPAIGETSVSRDAKRVCAGCTVRAECLDYAMVNEINHGIWGGLAVRERVAIRRAARAS